MLRTTLIGLALASSLFVTGCGACCKHPWLCKNRACCPPPCDPCGPAAVPAVPNGGFVAPPPATSGFGPTPNVIVPAPNGYRY
jgi:hypothetical protein